MRIEIICTGDEIVTGKTVNTNYSYMARRLVEVGLTAAWGTIVGDDRERLVAGMHQAATRADAVVVNGGLGPTVDDLSQEAAAEAAGVRLELDRGWLERIEAYYARRGRVMPSTNRKQAMLPAGSEIIDNPVGTACGFLLSIGGTPFFFTPGVPREMRAMFEERVIPRLMEMSGGGIVSRVKRFHTFGIGESRADQLLQDVPGLTAADGLKLGFQAHYPQLEIKLVVHAANTTELDRKLAPVEAEVRCRLGNFLVAEDEQTLERSIVDALRRAGGSVATMETFTGGIISSRLLGVPGSGRLVRRGIVSREPQQLFDAAGLEAGGAVDIQGVDAAARLALALKTRCGSTHALVVLVSVEGDADGEDCHGDIVIGIVRDGEPVTREASLIGSTRWIRLGAGELGLDCLRRLLYGLPVDQRIDFEIRS